LQKDKFLDAALRTREELRRVKYVLPEKRSEVPPTGPSKNVFFVTDRVDEKDPDPAYRFGGARGDLIWGRAEVEVDPERPLGSGDTNSVRLANVMTHPTKTAFVAEVKAHLSQNQQRAVLLYIHGFKSAFKTAIEGAAQIAADTRFNGATVIFSWPSDGSVARYPSDEEEVQASKDNFITSLQALSEITSLQKINVITHSMGGRLAANSLEWLVTQPAKGRPRLYHLILAAPDIRVSHFRNAKAGMHGLSKNVTLYSSKWDQALQCSFYYHGAPRAGQAGANIVVIENVDTVDASAVETPSVLSYLYEVLPCTPSGHSYISQNPAVLSDLYELLAYDTAPNRRQRLHAGKKDGLTYWRLR
jgi:esterase/lipase superfamily enzyme